MSFDDLTRFNDDEIKQLKEEIWNAPVVYEWVGVDTKNKLATFLVSFFSTVSLPMGIAILENDYSVFLFSVAALAFGVLYPYNHFLINAPIINKYQLTSVGIRYTSQADIPDFVYTAVRYIAWGGVLLSVFAMAVMGPLALIGAGGFALLAVGFVNYKPKSEMLEFFFLDKINIKYYKKRNIIRLFTDCNDLYHRHTVYLNDDIYPFFNALSKQVTISNYSEVKSRRDL
ncbi:hypothetical protein [Photobacterium leiognathi]|uniref:hypothetical protein n=1 Tax=Photobacterium leiognathi TaxID=553611 RepID=UPI0029817395|nr:hypothetical protein [Photobacterium leiognathi]